MNNLLTEVSRIQEIIGESKKILNEGTLGTLFKNVAEAELIKIIRNEVRAAIKAGVKEADVVSQKSASIQSKILKKTGLKELTGAQKSGLKAETLRIAKEEAKQGAKQLPTKSGQNIVNKSINNITINLGAEAKSIANAGSKVAKTTKGRPKKLVKQPVDEKTIVAVDESLNNGAKEAIEQEVKKGPKTWSNWKKWGVGIGTASVLWLLFYYMSKEGTPIPEDMPEDSKNADKPEIPPPTKTPPNKEVMKIQRMLVRSGYYIGNTGSSKDGVDGYYGKRTKAAYEAWDGGESAEDFNNRVYKMGKTTQQGGTTQGGTTQGGTTQGGTTQGGTTQGGTTQGGTTQGGTTQGGTTQGGGDREINIVNPDEY
jgi:hypothetical protein